MLSIDSNIWLLFEFAPKHAQNARMVSQRFEVFKLCCTMRLVFYQLSILPQVQSDLMSRPEAKFGTLGGTGGEMSKKNYPKLSEFISEHYSKDETADIRAATQEPQCSKNISILIVFTTATRGKLRPKWMENGTWLHWVSKTLSGNRSAAGCTICCVPRPLTRARFIFAGTDCARRVVPNSVPACA